MGHWAAVSRIPDTKVIAITTHTPKARERKKDRKENMVNGLGNQKE
jgi:hypothetical protein